MPSSHTLLGLLLYALVMVGIVRPFLTGFVRRKGATLRKTLSDLAVMLLTVLVSAYVTDVLGVHALFGAFFAGVIMPRAVDAERVFTHRIEPITTALLLPLFFASSGLRTSLPLINDWALVGETVLILAIVVAGKRIGSAVAARATGMTWDDALQIGTLLNTRGLVELVVLNIGLDLGILSPVL